MCVFPLPQSTLEIWGKKTCPQYYRRQYRRGYLPDFGTCQKFKRTGYSCSETDPKRRFETGTFEKFYLPAERPTEEKDQ